MYKCRNCIYTVKTPPVPRTCPQCSSTKGFTAVQLKDIAVKK
jgi:rubrerythrin